jgi:hypothetical protein
LVFEGVEYEEQAGPEVLVLYLVELVLALEVATAVGGSQDGFEFCDGVVGEEGRGAVGAGVGGLGDGR